MTPLKKVSMDSPTNERLNEQRRNKDAAISDAWASYIALGGYVPSEGQMTYQEYYAIAIKERDIATAVEVITKVEG
jgi:hypothetical protein